MRNLDEGDVEVWAEGDSAALAEFRAWLERGPSGAWVQSVKVQIQQPRGTWSGFSVAF